MFNESVFETLETENAGDWSEWNDNYEADERRRRGRPLPRPQQGNAAAKSPQAGYATKAELEATANRLDGRIAVNTKAIETVNGTLSSLGSAHNRLVANVKREAAAQKAATDALKQQTENIKMAVMLTPLISAPKTKEITVGGEKVKVQVDDGDTFRMILPMMMMSGGFGGSSGGSSNDMMMPMMMMLAFSK
jgi:vancomycin resistance protein YoaR